MKERSDMPRGAKKNIQGDEVGMGKGHERLEYLNILFFFTLSCCPILHVTGGSDTIVLKIGNQGSPFIITFLTSIQPGTQARLDDFTPEEFLQRSIRGRCTVAISASWTLSVEKNVGTDVIVMTKSTHMACLEFST